jgi:integrase
MTSPETEQHFTSADRNTKLVREIARLARRARLDYEGFRRVCAEVRKEVGLRRPPRSRRLPRILPEASLKRFYEAIQRGGNLQHEIMLKLLFYTAVRVSELVNIRVDDVDLDACKVFIESGKADKDRYILFPESFRLILKAHLAASPENRYRQQAEALDRRLDEFLRLYADLRLAEPPRAT